MHYPAAQPRTVVPILACQDLAAAPVDKDDQMLGQPHLALEDLAQVLSVPTSCEALGLDASFERSFLLE